MKRPTVVVHTSRYLPLGITAVHAFLTSVLVWWSVRLATTPETFASASIYSVFIHTWPYTEHGWAVVFGIAALVGGIGLRMPFQRRWWRLHLSAFLGLAHVVLAMVTYVGNPVGIAWGLYVLCAGLGLWRLMAEGAIECHSG